MASELCRVTLIESGQQWSTRAMPMPRTLTVVAAAIIAATRCREVSAFFVSTSTARHGSSPKMLSLRDSIRPARVSSGSHLREGRRPRDGVAMVAPGGAPTEGKFVRMGGTDDKQRFGPRCILAGGVSPEDTEAILSILEDETDASRGGQGGDDDRGVPLVLFTADIADHRVGDVLMEATDISLRQEKRRKEEGIASVEPVTLPSPVILVSGFANSELRAFATRFRHVTGVRAAFAKAVSNAMVKPVKRLCGEIAQDHADALAGNLHGQDTET